MREREREREAIIMPTLEPIRRMAPLPSALWRTEEEMSGFRLSEAGIGKISTFTGGIRSNRGVLRCRSRATRRQSLVIRLRTVDLLRQYKTRFAGSQ
jgi:hypothetical protein